MERSAQLELFWDGQARGTTRADPLTGLLGVDDGLRLQLQLLDRYRGNGETLGGWKLGLTSGTSRDAFGAGIRPFGFILASRILRSGTTIAHAAIPNLGLETELCFRIGSTLQGDTVRADAARNAVAAVMPAFELNQKRTDPAADSGIRTADNLSQWGIVIGDEQSLSPAFDLNALEVGHDFAGVAQQRVSARGHIDDHFESLATLARELHRFGLALEAGMHVITGAFSRANAVQVGSYRGDFGALGEVRAQFTA